MDSILAYLNDHWPQFAALINAVLDFFKKYFLKDDSIFAPKDTTVGE